MPSIWRIELAAEAKYKARTWKIAFLQKISTSNFFSDGFVSFSDDSTKPSDCFQIILTVGLVTVVQKITLLMEPVRGYTVQLYFMQGSFTLFLSNLWDLQFQPMYIN